MNGGIQMKTRKLSIRNKLLITISAMSIICCALLGSVTYFRVSDMMISQQKKDAMGLASVAAEEIEGSKFLSIQSEQDEYFQVVLDSLIKYKKSGTIEYIYTMKKAGDGLVFVVDADEENPAPINEEYEFLDAMKPAFEGKVCSDKELTSDEWGTYFSSYAPIFDEAGEVVGIVGCDITVESINKQLAQLRLMIIIIVVGCSILCLLCAFFISQNIGKNLTRLYQKVLELNSGNGDLTKKLHISSGDELEKIAQEFNRFVEQIRNLVSEVAVASNVVRESSGKVNELAKGSDQRLGEMTNALEMISSNMEETFANTELISEHLNQTATQVSELYEKAASTSKGALEISKDAIKVKDDTSKVGAKSQEMVKELQSALEVATEKCKEIEQIDAITQQILKVAHTTNILSLNAHTEAARAGAYGKGFNIIADNVSELSGQISILVKDIQNANSSVKETVASLLEITNDVSEFLNKNVLEDYNHFVQVGSEYSNNMNDMAEVLEGFYRETQVMHENISLIDQKLNEIDKVVGEATSHISSVHSLGVELQDETNELLKIAEDNSCESQKMSNQVNKYTFQE